jgi:hypothetical protein
LTYDYAYEHEGPMTRQVREFYKCCCGTTRCRGTIIKQPTKRRR